MGNVHKALGQVRKKAAESKQRKLVAEAGIRVIVGTATCGVAAGARQVVDALEQEIKSRKIKGAIVSETGCSGRCDLEPLVQVMVAGQPPVMYYHITPEKARRIVQQHLQNNDAVDEWAIT